MTGHVRVGNCMRVPVILGILALSTLAIGQDSLTSLLRLQRSKAYLNIDSNVQHAQGLNGVTYGNPGDVFNYPTLCPAW